MIHVFDTDVAQKYGVNAAIILQNIAFWIKQNEANKTNFYDGYYWTFNSNRAYQELFPYMSKRQIETAFKKLIDDGVLITGNYNKFAYDRTLWYALTQKGKCISHFGGMENPEMENGLPQNGKPIPDINPNVTPVVTSGKKKERKNNSFDSIIDQYLSPDGQSVRFEDHSERRELLQEWLKVRKAKRAAMTDRAIQMNIDKLDKIATESNMTVTEYLKEIICRGWAAFYPIKNFNGTGRTEKKPKWMQSTEPRKLDSDEIAAIQRMMNEETKPPTDFEAEAEAFRKRLAEIKEG